VDADENRNAEIYTKGERWFALQSELICCADLAQRGLGARSTRHGKERADLVHLKVARANAEIYFLP
jgi:hypothetical protein